MAKGETRDPDFFAAVHQMVERDQTARQRERRGGDRRPYECLQLVAPYRDEKLPDQSQFIRVQCQDLSAGGFSYLVPEAPDYQHLIVALGAVPFTFLIAQVMRHATVVHGDASEFLVGCRFTGRIETR